MLQRNMMLEVQEVKDAMFNMKDLAERAFSYFEVINWSVGETVIIEDCRSSFRGSIPLQTAKAWVTDRRPDGPPKPIVRGSTPR